MTDKNIDDARLARILNYDPITEAEIECGSTDLTSPLVMGVALNNQLNNSDIKREVLISRKDTYFSAPANYLDEIYAENGFELVFDEPFIRIRKFGDREETPEKLRVWAHRDGLVVVDETYSYLEEAGTLKVKYNGGQLYFNWQETNEIRYSTLSYSGGYVEDIELLEKSCAYVAALEEQNVKWNDPRWQSNPYIDTRMVPFILAAHIDTREGMLFNIDMLKKNGILLPKWIKNPIPWIIRSDEHSQPNENFTIWSNGAKEKSQARLEKMPEWVQEMIGAFV